MEIPMILGTGFVVSRGAHPGEYVLSTWLRSSRSETSEKQVYEALAFTELVDVILAVLDHNRPGYQLVEGGWQPALFE